MGRKRREGYTNFGIEIPKNVKPPLKTILFLVGLIGGIFTMGYCSDWVSKQYPNPWVKKLKGQGQ